MRYETKNLWQWCVGVLAVVGLMLPVAVQGQEVKPALTIAVSSMSSLSGGVAKMMEMADLGEQAEMVTSMLSGGPGIDSKRPLGVTLSFIDGTPAPMIFIPASDPELLVQMLVDMAQSFAAQLEIKKLGAGRYQIVTPVGPLSLIAKDKWISLTIASFEDKLPSDPAKVLAMPTKATVGVTLDFDQASREEVEMLIAPIQMLTMMQFETDLTDLFDTINTTLDIAFEGAHKVFFGIQIDPANGNLVITSKTDVRKDSELGEALPKMRDAKTAFGGFFRPDGAIMAINDAGPLLASQREITLQSLDTTFATILTTLEETDDANAAIAMRAMKVAKEVITKTLEQDSYDGAMTWGADCTFVGAVSVAGADKLLDALRPILEEIKGDRDIPAALRNGITLKGKDIAGYQTVRLTVNTGAGEQVPATLRGRTIEVIVAADKKSFCLGIGSGNIEAKLTEAIAASQTPVAIKQPYFAADAAVLGKWLGKFVDKSDASEAGQGFAAVVNWLTALKGKDGQFTANVAYQGTSVLSEATIGGQLVVGFFKLVSTVSAATQQAADAGNGN